MAKPIVSQSHDPAAEPITFLSTLSAIEDAINRDERGDALAILQNARDVLTAGDPEPVTGIHSLRDKLDSAHLAIDHVDDFIAITVDALHRQDCDRDGACATVLEGAAKELDHARDQLQEAFDLLQGVVHG
jgi:hypothetical protein